VALESHHLLLVLPLITQVAVVAVDLVKEMAELAEVVTEAHLTVELELLVLLTQEVVAEVVAGIMV
jgi:hypothetical protein